MKEGGCVARDSACLLFQVKRPYLQAGLVTISDQAIVRHLKNLNEEDRTVRKLKSRSTGLTRQVQHEENVVETFHIVDPVSYTHLTLPTTPYV